MRANQALSDKQATWRSVHIYSNLLRPRVHKHGNVHTSFFRHWLQVFGPHSNNTLLEAPSAAAGVRRAGGPSCFHGEWYSRGKKVERCWFGDNSRHSRSSASSQLVTIEKTHSHEVVASQHYRILLLQRQWEARSNGGWHLVDLLDIHEYPIQRSQVAAVNVRDPGRACIREF